MRGVEFPLQERLNRRFVFFTSANTNYTVNRRNEDLAISNFPSTRNAHNHIDDFINTRILNDDFELDLGIIFKKDLAAAEVLFPAVLISATMNLIKWSFRKLFA